MQDKGPRAEWHLKFCKLFYGKVIWTKKASLVTRGCCNQFPNGKEAKDGPFFRTTVAEARRHGDLYFAALLPQDRILKAFGTARAAWQGWVYTPAITVWVFLSQCLSPDHSCRDAVARLIAWRLAQGLFAVFGRHRSLLYGAKRFAGRSPSCVGARNRRAGRGRIATNLALAWAESSGCGRVHPYHARYAGESSGVSTAKNAEAWLRLSYRPKFW